MTQAQTPAGTIRSQIQDISRLTPEEFVRNDPLGNDLDFSRDRAVYEDLIAFSAQIVDLPWEKAPTPVQDAVLNRIRNLSESFNAVSEFAPLSMQGADLEHERDYAARVLRDAIEGLKQEIIPLIGFLTWDAGQMEAQRQAFQAALAETQAESRRLVQGLEESHDESRQIVEAMRSASRAVGADREARTFREAARRYDRGARRWLWASIASAFVTIGAAFALVLVWATDGALTDAEVLQFVLAKAAMLAVLTYGTVTAVRLYRSNAHLAAVNRHREDALLTFQAFVEGSSTEETRDQVLLAAARAAFGQTPTGLVSDKGDGGSMLEVLTGIASNVGRRS